MSRYIATFYTHLSALRTAQALKNAGLQPISGPVPRELSSSCGVCVRFEAERDCRELLDTDFETLREQTPDGYRLLCENE